MNKLNTVKDFDNFKTEISKDDPDKIIISICSSSGCRACGSNDLHASFEAQIKLSKVSGKITLKRSGCHGYCEKGPIVIIHPEKIYYMKVKPEDARDIIEETIKNKKIIERLIWKENDVKAVYEKEIPFYKYQVREILEKNSLIEPGNIRDYISIGGYSALKKALFGMSRENVLKEVKESKLRGRGGAGFLTGVKWESTKNCSDPVKYVIVNGDEGDPGAFMDGSILEGNPHSVLEGLMICAYAINSSQGYFYIRQEYPLALEKTQRAIKEAKESGLLGKNILGSDFSFDVEIHRGAGAFVSGESSALMSAIEGKVGQPRLKYIRSSEKGLWDKPSNLNNVETYANVPLIINKGADWFKKIGTANSTGTKIFSLVGKVKNTGLVEVPMGITLRSIIYDIGGGIKNGRKFKAVQIGGPSGGCLPEKFLDTPIDFDELTSLGAMMGSGGLIVMDEDSCMIDVAKYFMEFLMKESCGKCIPCREGVKELHTILDKFSKGMGTEDDIQFLEDVTTLLSEASLCALGSSAPNPVLTALKYFREEFDAHIKDKKCPAKVCKALISYTIDKNKCIGCGICAKSCPKNAIAGENKKPYSIKEDICSKCGICIDLCPEKVRAISKISKGK